SARNLEIGSAPFPYSASCAEYCGDQATPAALACRGLHLPGRSRRRGAACAGEWRTASCPLAQPRNQCVKALGSHGTTPFSGKDVRPSRLLALQAPQSAYLITLHRMHARRPTLSPADMQTPRRQLDLMPLQIA